MVLFSQLLLQLFYHGIVIVRATGKNNNSASTWTRKPFIKMACSLADLSEHARTTTLHH